ncbi:MAG: tRNA (adenosine(37)-N6)-dimethylallyltransferase MiaA [Thermosynechococcaceae cyanobacterium MS004]|nr:tRNA (adenosine(37)-N6)-dimethylallyltransferase MiaA [Thermosynechococcaceae cyanobacterium MS004]
MQPKLIVICGATATGKTALALTCAERLNSPILSADSRQVYQAFDIGTAKPTMADRARVPHYLVDICPPTETLTAAQYQQIAQALIAAQHTAGVTPILVGGTGLYIQSIVQGLKIPRVPPQPTLRSQFEGFSQGERHQWLRQVDPASAAKIHGHDAVRTLRALEVYYATGIPLSVQQGANPPSYPILQIGLELSDPALYDQRIQARTQAMLRQGWIEEVQQIMERYTDKLPLLQTLGYSEIVKHLKGKLSLDQAIAHIVLRTRQFAKRQRTWFRADPSILWFDAAQPDLAQSVWATLEAWMLDKIPSKPEF